MTTNYHCVNCNATEISECICVEGPKIAIKVSDAVVKMSSNFDPVAKPEHYHSGGIDPWKLFDSCLTNEMQDGYDLASAIAYLARQHRKNGIEDVKKAVQHLNRMIERHEKVK